MRCRLWVLCLLTHRSGLACNSRLRESQISKLSRASGPDEGQPDNRKLIEPSAMRQIQINRTQIGGIISVCSAELQATNESSAWLTGILSGGCGKRGNPSCRGGGAVACPLFGARDSKEASLLYHPSRCHRIVVYGECPGAGDNGNRRMLAVTTARGTSALDHSAVSAVCFVWGLLARCRMNSDKEVASSLRSQSTLFSQWRGADSLEETSGRAGVSRGDSIVLQGNCELPQAVQSHHKR